ncbi:type VI secretion system contractile sheath small subunit [Frischella perrara]|jgi:type VI secretion protein, VC_A0107 family|uniref:Type VI secretion protein n=1 Tax=Frischella perrara TaxID=1267021 RepID=A0A0A7S218_FRIPE|nr:type VI secretion system contractile sheath small subunit [Frischella perrara]AJA45559.1 type VI secretion protein [Frischella perrara]MCT6875419.1 type VI secretion system contractile sheath small subunit [Frischella perrara]PWV58988.1 type VI secretion system protein ImpB [Frischella perrara]
MANKEGSVAPKERINIKYTTETNGQVAEKELPLHMLVTGDFLGKTQDIPIEERKPISVDKNNFNAVMSNAGIELEFAVPNRLEEDSKTDIPVKIKVESLNDLSPDNIAKNIPELNKLLALRESLVALKGPLGNKPAFRAQLEALIGDETSREQLLKELNMLAVENDNK